MNGYKNTRLDSNSNDKVEYVGQPLASFLSSLLIGGGPVNANFIWLNQWTLHPNLLSFCSFAFAAATAIATLPIRSPQTASLSIMRPINPT